MIAIKGMKGLGDNIMQRAFVKTLARDDDVCLVTPWPELYDDLPRVSFLHDDTTLRTQRKNVMRQPQGRYRRMPQASECRTIAIGYGAASLSAGSIVQAMQGCFGCAPGSWDLPSGFPRYEVSDGKPIAVVRPVTERREWFNAARNCKPEYVAHVAADLMASGYHVISVADLEPKNEWLVGDPPPAHVQYHAGQLGVRDLLGLIQSAAVVVGPVGFIVPACIAAHVPLFCILGGQGEHNSPSRVTHASQDLSHVGFATPDRFCLCSNMRHECNKENSHLAEQWATFRREQSLRGTREEVADVDT